VLSRTLKGKDEEHDHKRKPKDNRRGDALRGLLFLKGHPKIIKTHLPRHCLVKDFFQSAHGLG
jgi:hypothetical protein